jgi:hypothetical protein
MSNVIEEIVTSLKGRTLTQNQGQDMMRAVGQLPMSLSSRKRLQAEIHQHVEEEHDKKKVKKWEVWCGSCDVAIHLDVESTCSTDQGAQFLIVPTVICAKCQSIGVANLVEVEVDG